MSIIQATDINSGITEKHRGYIKEYCKLNRLFIIFRPVNPLSTELIATGECATKSLDIKCKSSDWGPHAGYIPSDANISKNVLNLNGTGSDTDKFLKNKKESLKNPTQVDHTQLMLSATRKQMLIDKGFIKLSGTSGTYSGYQMDGDLSKGLKAKATPIPGIEFTLDSCGEKFAVSYKYANASMQPLNVVGYKNKAGNVDPVTADYDLFAICPNVDSPLFNSRRPSELVIFDTTETRGQLSSLQERVIEGLEKELKKAGTKRCINHGTELNNPFPEKDTSYVVFTPAGEALIVTAKNMPQLFTWIVIHGYHMYINQHWNSTHRASFMGKLNNVRGNKGDSCVTINDEKKVNAAGLKIASFIYEGKVNKSGLPVTETSPLYSKEDPKNGRSAFSSYEEIKEFIDSYVMLHNEVVLQQSRANNPLKR